MKSKNIKLNLSEVANGAVQEKFEHELARVAKNIEDPNTDAKKKRKITINIDFMPTDDRSSVIIGTQVKPTLVPEDAVGTTLLIGQTNSGSTVVNELKSGVKGQTYFDPEDSQLKDDKGEPIEEVEDKGVIDFKKNSKKAGTN